MYLTTIAITPDPELAELRDAEIEFVDKAKATGLIRRLYLAEDKGTVQIVFEAESEEAAAARQVVETTARLDTIRSRLAALEPQGSAPPEFEIRTMSAAPIRPLGELTPQLRHGRQCERCSPPDSATRSRRRWWQPCGWGHTTTRSGRLNSGFSAISLSPASRSSLSTPNSAVVGSSR